MSELTRQAELLKLARTLDVSESSVDFLADVEVDALRRIREGVTEALFEKFRPRFAGFARMSSLLPLALSAKISERVLGPTLSARVAGEMAPAKAIEMAARLPDAFLADICLQMEPQRAQAIVAGFPVARAVAITRRLLARVEYITMGRFVDVLPRATLLAATDVIENGADLLQIGFFVEDAAQLDIVIGHLSEARRETVIQAAARQGYWPEIVNLLMRLSCEARLGMARQALVQDDATIDGLIRSAAAHDLWPSVLAIGAELPTEASRRLAAQPAFDEPAVVRSLIDSVQGHALWSALFKQFETMGADRTARLLAVAVEENPGFLADLARQDAPPTAARTTLAAAGALLDADSRQRAVAACGAYPLGALLAGTG